MAQLHLSENPENQSQKKRSLKKEKNDLGVGKLNDHDHFKNKTFIDAVIFIYLFIDL